MTIQEGRFQIPLVWVTERIHIACRNCVIAITVLECQCRIRQRILRRELQLLAWTSLRNDKKLRLLRSSVETGWVQVHSLIQAICNCKNHSYTHLHLQHLLCSSNDLAISGTAATMGQVVANTEHIRTLFWICVSRSVFGPISMRICKGKVLIQCWKCQENCWALKSLAGQGI